ncbi:hypothetical protein ACFLV7_12990 [Chloroflexota bacterium]
MNVRRVIWIVVPCVLVVTAVISACSVVASPKSVVDIQEEIDNAVKATVIALSVEAQLAASPTTPPPTATEIPPTATPFPTPTATSVPVEPTNTPLPTATLSANLNSEAVIWADANTNCRLGPNRAYKVDGYLMLNDESSVHGRDDDENWWYIANPTKDDKYCWVWDETTNVEGDVDSLPVITPSPMPKKSKNWAYYGSCGCPINMKYEGKYVKWYDIKACGCQKYEACKYPQNCCSKNVSDCCKQDLKKYCKEYCWPKSCKSNWRNINDCQPICCKW